VYHIHHIIVNKDFHKIVVLCRRHRIRSCRTV